jgi:hypothetical protein
MAGRPIGPSLLLLPSGPLVRGLVADNADQVTNVEVAEAAARAVTQRLL